MTHEELPQLDPFAEGLPEVAELIARANEDSDPASMVILGESFRDCAGALLVIRGGMSARLVYQLLVGAGLITAGKGIAPWEPGHPPEVTAPALHEHTAEGLTLQIHPQQ